MTTVPVLLASRDRYYGGIITPSGFRYYYGSTLPDNFVAMVDLATNKSGNELILYAMEVLKGCVYDYHDISLFSPFPVVRFTSTENAKKLAMNSVGYPCRVLYLLGADFVKLLDNSVAMYELDGEYFYCEPVYATITLDPNVTPYKYHIACLMARYPSKFVVRNGKVYYGNEVVVEDIESVFLFHGNPKYLLSWENMFEIMCSISRAKELKK
ncbi:hypothetical protein AFV8_gp59 [Betalipothrixvirus puteoliense]|uniref:Uncharacterized protein n=1 Tax=Betalipothrixvirus puteoliense TaxID=346884 RepID=A7WKS8_9VIRU|nr:hypothetical protein AFV8_gp59 [Acidianus filamentous virus 8]CAL69583.1 conserved hypothetical protein [Acidianus filamentous virus 8]